MFTIFSYRSRYFRYVSKLLFFDIFQEDSKIFRAARFLEKFFISQLEKLLPDYLPKRSNDSNGENKIVPETKRSRLDMSVTTEIIDDTDDDVILA